MSVFLTPRLRTQRLCKKPDSFVGQGSRSQAGSRISDFPRYRVSDRDSSPKNGIGTVWPSLTHFYPRSDYRPGESSGT
jgi:hypothetical protein